MRIKKNLYPIYFYQFFYIFFALVTALVSFFHGATLLLTASSMVTFLIILFFFQKVEFQRITIYILFIIIFSISFIIISNLYKDMDRTAIVTIVFLIVIYIYIKKITITERDFLNFINITYFVYLFLSIILYFLYYKSGNISNQFVIDLGFFSFRTLVGISGTTATIDSYTLFVLLVNIFYGQRNKLILLFLIFIVLWTARMTPLIAFFIGLFTYYVVKNEFIAKIYIFIFFLTLFILFYFIYNYSEMVAYDDLTLSYILFRATHGRNIIWENQLHNIIENFTVLDYLFGNLKYAEITVYWSENSTVNSHNSFLFNFFHFGLFSILFLIFYLIRYFKNFDRKSFALIITIFTSALTNSEILIAYNPIYLISLVILIFLKKKEGIK